MIKECEIDVPFKNRDGFFVGHYTCGKPAKYIVSYLCPVRRKTITKKMCGIHYNQVKKNSERLKKTTGYDSKVLVKPITKNKNLNL